MFSIVSTQFLPSSSYFVLSSLSSRAFRSRTVSNDGRIDMNRPPDVIVEEICASITGMSAVYSNQMPRVIDHFKPF